MGGGMKFHEPGKHVLIMRYLSLILIPTVIFLITACSSATTGKNNRRETVFIDNVKGNDKNRGDRGHPLKSISGLNRILLERDVNIFFAGGQVFDGTLILYNREGSLSDSVIINSFGKGKAVINGGKAEAIRIENCRFVSLKNIDICGAGRKSGNTANGLSFVRTYNSKAENIDAYGFQISGVDLFNCTDMVVRKVFAHDNGFSGINVSGSERDSSKRIAIRDCKAENNPGDPTITDNHSGNGILVGVSDSVLIDHCTATENGWDMPRQGNGPVGIWAWESNHVIIQYCISYRNKTSPGAKDGGGFDLDGGVTNSLIQYCLSYENQGAGYGLFQYYGASDWAGNIIRYCVSINDAGVTEGAGSFFIWNGSGDKSRLKDCYIYNNVAYSTKAPLISFENSSDHENFIFSNNIFIGSEQIMSGKNTGSMFLRNVWWKTGRDKEFMNYKSLAGWAAATGQETENGKFTGIQENPGMNGPFITKITDPYLLNNLHGYTLRDNSGLRDKGVPVKSFMGYEPPAEDFYGNPVPAGSAPEPGIYELKKSE